MDIASQKIFLKLAANLHFYRTAQECFITPSALSRLIQRIEREIGSPLFERDNRSVRLTHTGKAFNEYARKSVRKWEAFHREINEKDKALTGILYVSCSVTASYTILDRILFSFRKKHPRVQIRLMIDNSGNAAQKVLMGESDMAVLVKPEKTYKQMVQKDLMESPIRFIVAKKHPFAQEEGVRSALDMRDMPFIMHKDGYARKRLEHWLKTVKLKPMIYAEVTGNEAVFALICLGFGIGIVSDLFLRNNPQRTKVKIVEVIPAIEPYSIVLCAAKKRFDTPLVQAFWKEADAVQFNVPCAPST